MNVGLLVLLSLGVLALGYRVYGAFVARRLGLDPGRATPALTHRDDVDFVPTHPLVLFGQHFAAIAAAGPIVGPTLAVTYGFLPAWLWIVLGVIFIGAVHDFSALFVSMREKGRSVAEVARATLGRNGFLFYVSFALILCVLVCAAFLQLAAQALTSAVPLPDLGLSPGQTLLRTVPGPQGEPLGALGGIASTSVIVMTLLAPGVGWLLYRKHWPVLLMSALCLGISTFSAWIGFGIPVTTTPSVWMSLIAVYTLVAGAIPIWLLLQPRDFINVHFLYLGLATMVGGLIAAGLRGVTLDAPAMDLTPQSAAAVGAIWPFLFVTIACGAVSGAHGLICGGTTCKQLMSERHARIVGYGGMLLEAVLGVCVVLVVLGGLGFAGYRAIVWPASGPGNPPLAFALGLGKTLQAGFGLPSVYGTLFGILLIEGFVLTTIDTIIRLSRYLLEELWATLFAHPHPLLRNRVVNSLLPVAGMVLLAFTNGYKSIWPIFGSANQLLAALTLIAVTAWLRREGRRVTFTALPAVFMVVTTFASLVLLFPQYVKGRHWALVAADVTLFFLALGVVVLTAKFFAADRRRRRAPLPSPAA
jgi:carbon starvation protein